MTVTTGKQVSLEYTVKLDDKTVVDSNVGDEPLTYTHGNREIVPGLEMALEGMGVGDSKQVTVEPAQAYGNVDPQEVRELPKDKLPSEGLVVGTQLQATYPDGRVIFPRVAEVKQETVVLDFNHPLAGKTLHFDVKVLEIKSPGSAGAAT